MDGSHLVERARRAAGLSQGELARRAGTSRPTLSAYENGRKSPSLVTLSRLLAEAGFDLEVAPRIEFRAVTGVRGPEYFVPDRLWRLPIGQALATVTLPLTLNWSDPGRQFRMARRSERARVYEIVLREGAADDIRAYIDGALLVDLWEELVLPRDLRAAWTSVIVDSVVDNVGPASATAV